MLQFWKETRFLNPVGSPDSETLRLPLRDLPTARFVVLGFVTSTQPTKNNIKSENGCYRYISEWFQPIRRVSPIIL